MTKIIALALAILIASTATIQAASYSVIVKRIGDNLYRDLKSGVTIKTSMCLNLSLGNEATLIWNMPIGSDMFAGGKLIFHDDSISCQVDAVY